MTTTEKFADYEKKAIDWDAEMRDSLRRLEKAIAEFGETDRQESDYNGLASDYSRLYTLYAKLARAAQEAAYNYMDAADVAKEIAAVKAR